jgi:hypothetical protein
MNLSALLTKGFQGPPTESEEAEEEEEDVLLLLILFVISFRPFVGFLWLL